MRDLTAAEAFQFPRVFYPDPERPGGRVRWVSIPVRALDEEPDLDELVRTVGTGARNSEHDAGRIEIREDVFDAWSAERVIGLAWDPVDEADLFATAEALRRGER
ncbi:MAG: hypothetical protein U0326_35580 [Polyangiales bacterium]